jgi:uncharacterized protein (DUF2252 family)
MAKSENPKDPLPVSLLTGWQDFLSMPLLPKERSIQGKEMRDVCPRSSHGQWKPSKDRRDPLELLASQDASRTENLIPLRYKRMLESPFAFFRGAALIMASDLATMPRTQLPVQLCGDCHLSNFGIFATPERNVIFDLNDFDETLPGPFEWDLKRLATSFAVTAKDNGFTNTVAERCVASMAKVYRRKMEEFAQMSTLEVWYHRIDWERLIERIKKPGRKMSAITNLAKLKEKRSHAGALSKLTEIVGGKRRIKDQPPLIYHTETTTQEATLVVFKAYLQSLWQSRRRLLQRYHLVDIAAKVVGVGSVGTAAGIVLLQGEGGPDDQIILQIKEAGTSVLEAYLGRTEFEHPGERIVNGQRILQAASDMFLGWATGPLRTFYIRQLMDMKASIPIEELDALTLEQYAQVCGYALARAHARTGDPAMISGYLGKADTFDEALTNFAMAYMKQNEEDHSALVKAVKRGEILVDVSE